MKTILIVENNEELRDNTAELLILAGYSTIVASNGQQGFEYAKRIRPDVILCDNTEAETSCSELLTQIRGDGDTADIPFILFSENPVPEIKKIINNFSADGFIRKPFTEEDLLDTIHEFVD